jgi:quercetin dioxygenase-like cupin family protein
MDLDSLHHVWSALPKDRPMPLVERRRIVGSNLMVSEVRLERGFRVAAHRHENEQFAIVVEGKLRFHLGTSESELTERIVSAGEVLCLPSNLWHAAEALQDSRVLDVFSPPSETTGIDVED